MPAYLAERRTRILGSLLCAAFCLGLSTQPAHAESDEEYRRAVEEAVREYKAGNWHEALTLFHKAHDLNPSARTRRGLGLASFESRRYVDAIRWLTEALNSPVQPLTEPMREEVKGVLARAREFVGSFTLTVIPQEAKVLLDGGPAYVENGTLLADPGDRRLVVSSDGYQSVKRTLSIHGGDNGELRIELDPVTTDQPIPPTELEPSPEPDALEEEDSDGDAVLPWIAIGGGAVLTAAGGVLIGLTLSDISKVENADGSGREIQAAHDRVPVLSTVGISMAAVGLAGAGVGIYLLSTRDSPPADSGAISNLRVRVGASGVSLYGQF